ncbi:MAG: bifunctional adenosylcobinamide kinase/adenosylcobinamide-phosphate guanylyltransferase [Velocimicrobium sp.]
MNIFISGGCKNGKSSYAQNLAILQKKENSPLYYVATMEAVDLEDEERIRRHVRERDGLLFETIECSRDIIQLLTYKNKKASFLIDSTTALLANEMFQEGKSKKGIAKKIGIELEEILKVLDDVVIVSDYIFSDAALFFDETCEYQKNLAYLDQVCANNCEIVLEIFYGNVIVHKGGDKFEALMERSMHVN